ncbi:Oidioi.mRNA.OKI2018_I69.chr2.g7097.t1.cds [Oikopleura dioica]|uniref:Oidioi.mRNA.OKI2018_I69.chr2.g7097.t1.cds n=1 Tax=Oikopleura dioica TaxID=34765 RepID=A0ABN7T5Q2_OIKDI|nr:Oidioi.mRNA.OKI2018_I69.chr2.g7097.t1.cds [Oikopleura dioica]
MTSQEDIKGWLRNHKIIISLVFLIIISLIGRASREPPSETTENRKSALYHEFKGIPLTADLDLWKNECQPQDGIIFLKKHKTASTTFKDIVDKWLHIIGAFSKMEKPQMGVQGGCFPAKFNELCWGNSKRNDPVLAMEYHFRWNMDYLPPILDPNRAKVKTFTTVREPLATFRSTYNYFYKNSNNCEWACWGFPYNLLFSKVNKYANGKPNQTIEEFLDILPNTYDASIPFAYRSFELGMDFDRINDMEYVKESLARLDKQFDLVLITEHFWEGIVLMKHMLCAEYEHLYQESTNVRKYEIEPLNAERQATFEEFHKTDTLMYDYFNASLHRKIEAFGHEKMKEEIQKAKDTFTSCAEGIIDCSAKNLLLKRKPAETEIVEYPKMKLSEFLDITEQGHGACTNPGHPFTNAKMLYETGSWNYLHMSGGLCGVKQLLSTELDTKVPLTDEFKKKYEK